MRRAAAQLLDRLGPVDFQVAAVCGSNGMRGRCGSQREAVFLRGDDGMLQGASKLQ